MKKYLIILAFLTGCTIPTKATLPVERPVLEPVTAEELQCLSDETYRKLEYNRRKLRQYAEKLEILK